MLSVQFISTMERDMIKSGIGIALLASFVGLSGCASKAETIGTAGGMAAGAADAPGDVVTANAAVPPSSAAIIASRAIWRSSLMVTYLLLSDPCLSQRRRASDHGHTC